MRPKPRMRFATVAWWNLLFLIAAFVCGAWWSAFGSGCPVPGVAPGILSRNGGVMRPAGRELPVAGQEPYRLSNVQISQKSPRARGPRGVPRGPWEKREDEKDAFGTGAGD